MPNIHSDKILILDFGSQYTQLIARRIREIGIYCEIWAWDHDPTEIATFAPKGIILSGGPESVTEDDSPRAPQAVYDRGVPLLGICYGMQSMAVQLGGKVESEHHREFGYAKVHATEPCRLFDGLIANAGELDVWMSHGDRVTTLPEGFSGVAATESVPLVGMADEERHYYGLQFHPEVTHTQRGMEILRRFVVDLCACDTLWTASHIITDSVQRVREQVGSDRVLLGLSGGVDSSVVAALLEKAIGNQLTCVFVDTGLLRFKEGDQVMATMAEHMGVHVIRVNAAERFFKALKGVQDPEAKRKVIGRLFIEVFDEEAKKIDGVNWLAQGTIYPDVIESAGGKTGKAHVIKSHHNVGGLPERMNL
ncbi:glutamine-hydrolyzing GMP synthase, partial [Oleiagrimonas sp.]|uniref:glutamine-hydrolyzing GMP synthase n=1 Tax=Oleiagrimonas sp. TaxID=2010330 RepID=UPI00262BA3AA